MGYACILGYVVNTEYMKLSKVQIFIVLTKTRERNLSVFEFFS